MAIGNRLSRKLNFVPMLSKALETFTCAKKPTATRKCESPAIFSLECSLEPWNFVSAIYF